MQMKFSADINVMIRAAEKASRSLLRDFGEVERLQVSKKGPGDFVSAADRRAEEIIHEELSKARPDYGFLMEETGKHEGKNPDYRFIIDPLDGTRNFLHGLPHWAISIALEHKKEIIAGIVYDPVKDEMFRAEKNNGAFVGRKRLRVSARQTLDMSLIACGGARFEEHKKQQFFKEFIAVQNAQGSVRRFGAAALDLAYVAAGRYEAYWERYLAPWDIAAGILIVQESGGFVSDIDNEKNYVVESGNVIAANEAIFSPLKQILRSC